MKVALIIFIMSILAMILVSGLSSAQLVSYPTSCYGDTESVGFESLKACDRIVTNLWETQTNGYPHWLIVNFSANYSFNAFATAGTGPTHIDFQIPDGLGGWTTVDGVDKTCPGDNTVYTNFNLNKTSNLTNQIRLFAATGCLSYWDLREAIFSAEPASNPLFVVPATISVIGWLLGLIALALFLFGAWKFPLAIFVSGVMIIFLGLQLYSETHSLMIGAFTWLAGIFVILFGVYMILSKEGGFG